MYRAPLASYLCAIIPIWNDLLIVCYLHSLLKCGDSVSRKLVFPHDSQHRDTESGRLRISICKRLIVMAESGAQRASRVKGGWRGYLDFNLFILIVLCGVGWSSLRTKAPKGKKHQKRKWRLPQEMVEDKIVERATLKDSKVDYFSRLWQMSFSVSADCKVSLSLGEESLLGVGRGLWGWHRVEKL